MMILHTAYATIGMGTAIQFVMGTTIQFFLEW
jgi:hypothetical protein